MVGESKKHLKELRKLEQEVVPEVFDVEITKLDSEQDADCVEIPAVPVRRLPSERPGLPLIMDDMPGLSFMDDRCTPPFHTWFDHSMRHRFPEV